ncbi:unnamed protein product [Effrenium voratum]|nr:unnamed protein product [Effrenium voratum]
MSLSDGNKETTLALRSTFINTGKETEGMTQPCARQRSLSEPCSRRFSLEFFEAGHDYVSCLQQRAETAATSAWGAANGLANARTLPVRQIQEQQTGEDLRQIEAALQLSAGSNRTQAAAQSDAQSAQSVPKSPSSSRTRLARCPSCSEASAAQEAVEPPQLGDVCRSYSNPGSLGHPELCARSCLFFSRKSCTNGDSCHFCHGEHGVRKAHLDKRNREKLKGLPADARNRWLLQAMKLRCDAVGPDFGAKFMAVLQSSMNLTPDSEETNTRKCQRLTAALKHFPLSSLLALLVQGEQDGVRDLWAGIAELRASGLLEACAGSESELFGSELFQTQ